MHCPWIESPDESERGGKGADCGGLRLLHHLQEEQLQFYQSLLEAYASDEHYGSRLSIFNSQVCLYDSKYIKSKFNQLLAQVCEVWPSLQLPGKRDGCREVFLDIYACDHMCCRAWGSVTNWWLTAAKNSDCDTSWLVEKTVEKTYYYYYYLICNKFKAEDKKCENVEISLIIFWRISSPLNDEPIKFRKQFRISYFFPSQMAETTFSDLE